MCTRDGSTKAAVLPLPVLAVPRTSLPKGGRIGRQRSSRRARQMRRRGLRLPPNRQKGQNPCLPKTKLGLPSRQDGREGLRLDGCRRLVPGLDDGSEQLRTKPALPKGLHGFWCAVARHPDTQRPPPRRGLLRGGMENVHAASCNIRHAVPIGWRGVVLSMAPKAQGQPGTPGWPLHARPLPPLAPLSPLHLHSHLGLGNRAHLLPGL